MSRDPLFDLRDNLKQGRGTNSRSQDESLWKENTVNEETVHSTTIPDTDVEMGDDMSNDSRPSKSDAN